MAGPSEFFEEISSEHMKDFHFIDRGAFGDIYRVRHQEWGIDVAVKILNRNASFTRELLNEARAMDKARFLYVLRLYGLYVGKVPPDGTCVGLVMEYMENGSLSTLREWVSTVPWALRFRILHQVALGMNFLHNLSPPLLHLDLKPSNVLLDAELHVRVADFGLSKFKRGFTRPSSQASREGEGYGGTLEYLPPEAFADLNYHPTPGTDVYSYGILMWSVLAGQEPYPHLPPGNMSSMISRLIPQGQRPSTEALEKTDNVLNLENMIDLMKWCWHNDKTKRPPFRECTQVTEKAYSCHQPHIRAAVREVQDILAHRNSSSFKKCGVTSVQDVKKASLSPRRPDKVEQQQLLTPSSELEEKFETMTLTGFPSWQNEAAPSEASPKPSPEGKPSAPPFLQRSQSAYGDKGGEEAGIEETYHPQVNIRTRPKLAGRKPRPYSDTYLPCHPGYLPYQQQFYSSQVDARFLHQDHSLLPQFQPRSSYNGIHIHGQDIRGVQFGDHNNMHIEMRNAGSRGKKP
ncbi:receptor-interacting serine/threonine-protein kinase 3 isoform X1 [Pogona vitticeps]